MNHKKMRDIAIVTAVIFVVTIIVYPLIFGTDAQPKNAPPVELELGK